MKKLLMVALVAGIAGSVSAAYVSPLWETPPADPWGDITDPGQWGGAFPSGSTTGLVSSTTLAAWVGSGYMDNFALRVEAGIDVNGGGELQLRGGSFGSGVTTVYEIEDLGNVGFANVNLHADTLTMWSQNGENMELSILSGRVEMGHLKLIAPNGTINMRDGVLHSGTWEGATVDVNMLAGGSGNITVDDINNVGVAGVYLNFESGSLGSFTLGENAGVSADGNWQWAIANGRVSIDGLVDTDLASYNLTTVGNSSTIAMIPEPATFGLVGLMGGGLLWARKRFTI